MPSARTLVPAAVLATLLSVAGAGAAPAASHAALPLTFERNDGQAAQGVRFLARAPGYALALTRTGSRLALGRHHASLTARFVAPSPTTTVAGTGTPSARVNYLTGARRGGWRTGVPAYAGVTYRGVWPGIDVAFHGDGSELEYDYTLAPGADPSRIGQRLAGARSLRIAANGDLVIGLPGGSVRQRAPRSFQTIGNARVAVASRFVLHGRTVRIALGRYDRTRALTIDPSLSYATYLGGTNTDFGLAAATDEDGNAYITGQTWSPGLATDNAYNTTGGNGTKDAFVAKLAPGGDRIEWLTYLGGANDDEGAAIKVDDDGDVFVGGDTRSNDFPTISAYQPFRHSTGPTDTNTEGFVAKLGPDGDRLEWATYLGGGRDESLTGLVLDSAGDVIVAGTTASRDFPVAGGGLDASSNGGRDGYVAELSSDGSALQRGGYLGGSDGDNIIGLAIDSSDRVYVAGESDSQDYPIAGGAPQSVKKGSTDPNDLSYYSSDGVITRLDDNLGSIGFSTYLGGTNSDIFTGIAADDDGNAYVVGDSISSDFPVSGDAYQRANANPSTYDAVVAKVPTVPGPSGWATYLGGQSNELTSDVGLDSDGNVYVTGQTSSADFPVSDDAFQSRRHGADDAFLSSFSPDGADLDASTYIGGADHEFGNGLTVGRDGDVVVTGSTYSSDFPAGDGSAQSSSAGGIDAFVYVAPTRRATAVSLTCGTPSITPGRTVTCTATVTDRGDGPSVTPTGTVGFETDDDGVFSARTCDIDGPHASGACGVEYTPTTVGSGRHTITAYYRGDGQHAGSSGSAVVIVRTTGGGGGDDGGDRPGGNRDDDNRSDNPNNAPRGSPPGLTGTAGDDVIDELGFSSPMFRAADSGPSATAAATPTGTIVTFTLTRPARVTFTVQKPAPGRSAKHGRRTTCDKPSKKNKRKKACVRWVAVKGSFARDGAAGANRFRFTGRMAGRKLAPGRYRLVATPSAGGGRLAAAYAAFRIVR